jgi:serine/threonine-protein kinase
VATPGPIVGEPRAAQPEPITGSVAATPGRPDGPRERRDPTPATGAPRRGKPAKGLATAAGPSSIVVGALIALAAVVAVVLWATLRFSGGESTSTTTVLPGAGAGTDASPDATSGAPAVDPAVDPAGATTVAPAVSTDATIVAIAAYDPAGDGEENDAEASAALADGDPGTAWRTVCYEDRFMGAKPGVGVVVSFDAPTQQPISVDVLNAPYQLQFFASDAEQVPGAIDQWGPELGTKAFGPEPATVVSAAPPTPARHVLLLFNELGVDDACTGDHPYRGRLGEIALSG